MFSSELMGCYLVLARSLSNAPSDQSGSVSTATHSAAHTPRPTLNSSRSEVGKRSVRGPHEKDGGKGTDDGRWHCRRKRCCRADLLGVRDRGWRSGHFRQLQGDELAWIMRELHTVLTSSLFVHHLEN